MRVIGTAGHVDHGKSTLVKALTGIDPDRLKEEKEREMTIDLGFAWLTLPSGETVSIVDVPGHEAFIKNMLAGVGGIDAALLVIAADEGIMPQTREHLAILDLLQVKGGIVALTKIDAVPDAEWTDLVIADVRKELAGTVLADAHIVPVSSRTRQGLKELLAEIDGLLKEVAPHSDLSKPRLPIDRVFSIAGFGTVVTGTLVDGTLEVGQEVEVVPGGKMGRIRGLQTHKEKLERAVPGSRVAVNLSGLRVEDLARGQVVTRPGTIAATALLDTRLDYLASAPKTMEHNDEVDFFAGAAQVSARVRLLDREVLKPGESGWVQLHLAEPVALVKGERFIVRFASPSVTVGGGSIVDPHATTRHRRFRKEVVARLETLARGTPEEIVTGFLAARGQIPVALKEIAGATGMNAEAVVPVLQSLVERREALSLGGDEARTFIGAAGWRALVDQMIGLLSEFHRQFPLRGGLSREELKSRLGLTAKVFDWVIERAEAEKVLVSSADVIRLTGFVPKFNPDQKRQVDSLLAQFERAPFAPPSAQETEAALGTEVLNALFEEGRLVRLNESVLFSPKALDKVREWVVATIREQGQVTAAQVRDHFDTSRKFAIGLLEYLDEKRITKRVGDARVLR